MGKICVVGLGYIGLPTASLLATKGFQVHGVDCLKEIVDSIKNGKVHIYEPDLDVLVKSAVNSGHLQVATQPEEADVFVIAVPTPFRDEHKPDLSYVEAATREIAPYIKSGDLIVLESTSPVGTTEKIAQWLRHERPDLSIPFYKQIDYEKDKNQGQVFIAHCPERVLPGCILRELIENDRIIGGLDNSSAQKALAFYQTFVHGQIFLTDCRTAEMAKLTENAFRDVNIAFANELSLICDKLEISVWELIDLANRHPRVNILQPGPGVGGHCIAVDPWFIVDSAPEQSKLIHAARLVNDNKPKYIIEKVIQKAERFKKPVIACLGLAFKPDIDDLRESPSVEIVKTLAKNRIGEILAVEPHIKQLPLALQQYPDIIYTDTSQAVQQADIILLLVDHKAFKLIDRNMLNEKIVIDTRGMWR
ncbi:UDP-N-acetyl-D-mannosamine dehydrogenase [Sporomusa acidovorans]|uniref:UDP-N-acetyl-D-mannosamine dehydrogenase n=1 Tax=Sporomusa acidovorans (strain ATCC 49682 / DSM 3132 / Mol) TaxID=1123286 RepID=A0ABZ3J7Y5_SPOA4|nr:UDP-N-acetyl-D-mannosamine dehydrogenase [Sporomusa acidovorans]OZC19336.1 UDP-N-acetyl-D-glucosamine 6-dehydrogenase [Sporomusa acidovorans DSM 3132]SDD80397.1 UDP-N-acetyl-D-mannosaminuronic acid dehydrogenase [Sporomusa acidovorans]